MANETWKFVQQAKSNNGNKQAMKMKQKQVLGPVQSTP